jgi:hypothetical protein
MAPRTQYDLISFRDFVKKWKDQERNYGGDVDKKQCYI